MASSSLPILLLFSALSFQGALIPPALAVSTPALHELYSSPHHSCFTSLLNLAGLAPEIESLLPRIPHLTVLAPTDEAIMANTSPTLLAFLEQTENRGILRHVLLSHFIPENLTPYLWVGHHRTLGESAIPLAMDAQAFYAADVVLSRYNALIVSGSTPITVHALTSLIVPDTLPGGAGTLLLEAGTGNPRRVLQAVGAPAPAPSEPENEREPSSPSTNGAPLQARFTSVAAVGLGILAALLV